LFFQVPLFGRAKLPLPNIQPNRPNNYGCQDQVCQQLIKERRQYPENGVFRLVGLVPAASNVFQEFVEHFTNFWFAVICRLFFKPFVKAELLGCFT